MSAAHTVALDLSQQDAIEAVTAALATQGFGVLTTIDVRATLKAKLGEDVEDYTILGACNPALAHQALSADPEIGLLLPCNVTVRQAGGRTLVQAVDPAELLALAGDDVRPDDRARRRRPRRLRPPPRCPRIGHPSAGDGPAGRSPRETRHPAPPSSRTPSGSPPETRGLMCPGIPSGCAQQCPEHVDQSAGQGEQGLGVQ